MFVMVFVVVCMAVLRAISVNVFVRVMFMCVVFVFVEMHVELDAANVGFFGVDGVQMVTVEAQFFQFAVELRKIHAQINQRADKHIAAHAAENIEIQGFHVIYGLAASALIWLAA